MHPPIKRLALILGSYVLWTFFIKMVTLTLVTYFVGASLGVTEGTGNGPRFDEINEAIGATEMTVMGLTSFFYLGLFRWLNPLTSTTTAEIITFKRIERRFLPGLFHGSVLAAGLIFAFLVSGLYRFLGIFVQFEGAPLALANILGRIVAIALLVYTEEFIFRKKIFYLLRENFTQINAQYRVPKPQLSILAATGATSLLYCGVKFLQFDLGITQMTTLFLLSASLSLRAAADGDFVRGAGFLTAILILFQPILSLPILGSGGSGGSEFAGLLLVKPLPADLSVTTNLERFLTGGAGGPLSSLTLQCILLLDLLRGFVKSKKSLPSSL